MLNKKLKKVIASVTMFASVVCLSGVSMLAPLSVKAADVIVDGDLISSNAKNSDGTPTYASLDVYIVKVVGTKKFKRLILNPTVFNSYDHLKGKTVKEVDQSVVDGYTTSSLARVDGNDKVYALTPNDDAGAKSWINLTAAEFLGLSQSDPDSIYTINSTDGSSYSAKTDITTVAQLTAFYADGTLPTDVVVNAFKVALSADTPASGTVVAGSAIADLAHFNFSGKGTVSKIVLKRIGVSANADINNVYLFKGNTRLTDAGSFNSESTVTFNNASGIISVDGSETISVRADIAAGAAGTIGVKVSSYVADGTSTDVDLSGNLMSLVTNSSPATAKFGANSVSDQTVNAGATSYNLWSSTLNVGVRTLNLKGITFRFVGSAPIDSLDKIGLYVNGTQVGSNATVNAAGNIVFDLASSPVALKTGNSSIELRADVIKGSNREFQISIQNVADVMLADSQLDGVYIAATGTPDFTASVTAGTISVNAGSVAVSADPSLSGTVTGGASNVTIAKYSFKAYGEDMKVTSLKVAPALASVTPASTTMSNVMIYADGAQVGTSQNYNGTTLSFNLGSSLVIPAGKTVSVEIKGDTVSTAGVNYTGGTLNVVLSGAASNAQGVSSSKMSTVPSAAVTSTTLSVGTASAAVSVSSGYANQTVSPSGQAVKIGSYVIQAGSTEGVKVTNLQVALVFAANAATYSAGAVTAGTQAITVTGSTVNFAVGDVITIPGATAAVGKVLAVTDATHLSVNITTAGATPAGVITGATGPMTITNVSNLYTSENTTPVAPNTTNNFPVNFTVLASGTKTIDVFADLATLKAGTIATTLKITAISDTTNSVLTVGNGIATPLAGQTITVAEGTLSNPTLTASMPAQFIVGGTTADAMTVNFTSTTGTATIKELKFAVTGSSAAPIASIAIGSVSAPVIGGVAHLTGLNLLIPSGYSGLDVKVTPTFNSVGLGGQASNKTAIIKLSYMKYQIGNTTTENTTITTPISKTMTLVASKPAVVMASTAARTGLSNGLVKLMDVTVTADAKGNIKLESLPVSVTSTGAVTITSAADNLIVKDAQGTIIATHNVAFGVAAGVTGTGIITFDAADTIAAGASKTYSIYGTAATVAVDNKLSSTLGAATGFLFTDVNGNVQNIPGNDGTNTNILNYPTDTSSIES